MLVHCSMFRFKTGTSAEVIEQIETAFRELGDKIPYLRRVITGRNAGDFATTRKIAEKRGVRHLKPGYDLILTIHFDSLEDYHRYSDNDEHWHIVRNFLLPHQEERASIQYLAPSGNCPPWICTERSCW